MFERFTDKARRVVVLAQEEARRLDHNYIGSEHILLAIAADHDSVAARALESLDVSLDGVRADVLERVPRGQQGPAGHIPFTPSAKKTLELALREALQLGHNYIGTEHILLGLIREGEGVGAQVLGELGADLARTRQKVVELLSGPSREGGPSLHFESGPAPMVPSSIVNVPHEAWGGVQSSCSFCGRDLWDTGRHVVGEQAVICDVCIEAAQRVITEASEGETALVMPPRVFGTPPDEGSVMAISRAVSIAMAGVGDEEWIGCVEDGARLVATQAEVRARFPHVNVKVNRIRFRTPEQAAARFVASLGPGPGLPAAAIDAELVRRDGRWIVARESYCAIIQRAGVQCPPREDVP